MHFLFARNAIENDLCSTIAENKDVFLARSCVKQFLGFADDQLQRMTGNKDRGKNGQRPEIEAQFGYDVKAAMPTIRLLYECKELITSGTITMPRSECDLLIKARTGKYAIDKVVERADALTAECKQAEDYN